MYLRTCLLALLSTLSPHAAAGPGSGDDARVELRVSLESGSTLRFVRTVDETQTMNVMSQEMVTSRRIENQVALVVRGRQEDGSLLADLLYERTRGEISQPMQPRVQFDSSDPESPGRDNLLIAIQMAPVGRPLKIQLGPDGRIHTLEGFAAAVTAALDQLPPDPSIDLEAVKASVSDDEARQRLQDLFPILPGGPVEIGERWPSPASLPDAEPQPGTPIPTTELLEVKDQVATFRITTAFQRAEDADAEAAGTVSSQIVADGTLDLRDGLPLEVSTVEDTVFRTPTQVGIIPVKIERKRSFRRVDAFAAKNAADGRGER